jgi:hypothetical protein
MPIFGKMFFIILVLEVRSHIRQFPVAPDASPGQSIVVFCELDPPNAAASLWQKEVKKSKPSNILRKYREICYTNVADITIP